MSGGWAAPEGARADVVRASTRVLRRDASQVLARRGAAALRLDLARTSRCGGFKPMRAVLGATPPPGRRTARGGSRGTNEALSESANCLPSCSGGPWGRGATRWEALWDAPRRAARYGDACPPRIPIGRVKFAVRRTGAAQLRRRRFTSARATTFTALLRHTQHRARALRVFFSSSSSLSLGNRAYLG